MKKDDIPTPSDFARLVFGWEPFPYQKDVLDDQSKRILMGCGRQVGKSTLSAIRGLYEAVMFPNRTVLVLAPNQRQANRLFRYMKMFLNRNAQMPEERRIPVVEMIARETQTVIEFDNGSEILALPIAEDGSNVRGFTAHFIIIDEASQVDDDAYSAINPMLSTTNGTLMLLSTFNGRSNYFFKAFNDPEQGFNCHRFPSSISPLITKEFLEQERSRLPSFQYRQEYEAEAVDSAGSLFSVAEIEEAMSTNTPSRSSPYKEFDYYLGYDPARFGGDAAVAVILEDRGILKDSSINPLTRFAVVKALWMNQVSLVDQAELIEQLHSIWKFRKIIIDSTAVGGGLTDILVKKQYPIDPINLTIKSKQDLFFGMKRHIEAGQVMLPMDDRVRKEMLDIQMEPMKGSELMKFFPPKHAHDDFPTALALALSGLNSPVHIVSFGLGKALAH